MKRFLKSLFLESGNWALGIVVILAFIAPPFYWLLFGVQAGALFIAYILSQYEHAENIYQNIAAKRLSTGTAEERQTRYEFITGSWLLLTVYPVAGMCLLYKNLPVAISLFILALAFLHSYYRMGFFKDGTYNKLPSE
jgi:hypothetical protein